MQNCKFFKILNEIVCKFEKFDNDEFENNENERKNTKYVT